MRWLAQENVVPDMRRPGLVDGVGGGVAHVAQDAAGHEDRGLPAEALGDVLGDGGDDPFPLSLAAGLVHRHAEYEEGVGVEERMRAAGGGGAQRLSGGGAAEGRTDREMVHARSVG